VTIHLPPLRERIGDIPLLAERFLKELSERSGRQVLGLDEEALRRMQMYDWPGNVRQLENVMERAVVLSKNHTIGVEDLPDEVAEPGARGTAVADSNGILPLKKALEAPEKEIILRALEANHGSRQATAEALGINRTTLYKKMKRYGIEMAESAV